MKLICFVQMAKSFILFTISSFIDSDQNKIRNTSIYRNLQEEGQQTNPIVENGCQLSGYLGVGSEKVPDKYNGGFSIYSSAWSIQVEYPGRHFQSGLFGLWMGAQHDTTPKEKLYSKIEGGLGWWRDTRFATPTPKFIMGGVSLNFTGWANEPGAGSGRGLSTRDWKKPGGKYGVDQLSPNLLWPPDGLNLTQGTCGELFGYGYLPLPFIDPRSETDGQNIPTGGNCWTLFLNTKNFKGPATFFLPYFFSSPSVKQPQFSGQLLDARPSKPIGNIALENQNMPCVQSKDRFGFEYAKLAPIVFPRNQPDQSVVANHLKSYTKKALWDGVKKWFEGGPTISGKIDIRESYTHRFKARQPSSFKISNRAKEEKFLIDWSILSDPMVDNNDTFSYRWRKGFLQKSSINKNPVFLFPTYFRLEDRGEKSLWVPIDEGEVPPETGWLDYHFRLYQRTTVESYTTPNKKESYWKNPGPVAGPYKSYLGDGSVLTYYWYRFADQPALLHSDLTKEQREKIQLQVEKIHRHWKIDQEYLPEPTINIPLASLDMGLLVNPPEKYKIGYVSIVTKQELSDLANN